MKQNSYDDPGFFAKYSQMPRSIGGLDAAGEWSVFRAMLPELRDKKVLDLGCGYGWHSRYVREQHASSVVGVDLSEKMLERARAMTQDEQIQYQRSAIEDINYSEGEFDVVLSSLALHYVEDFDSICRKVYHSLAPGGTFVYSVEHPVYTALPEQDWVYGVQGEKLHWPVDRYHEEGPRTARFLDHDVVKYHRSIATQVNGLIHSGFRIREMSELKPEKQLVERDPEWKDAYRRPIFLLIAADK